MDLASPLAERLRRPSWRDPRLVVGLVLILLSVALGGRVLALADRTVPVYASRAALPAGTALTADRLTVVRVRLPTPGRYVDARQKVPSGLVVLRTIGPGELVPLAAVGSAADLRLRAVVVPLEGAVPPGVVTAGRVDVWASARAEPGAATGSQPGTYSAPKLLAGPVEVTALSPVTGGLGAARTGWVQVLLTPEQLPPVLDALANGARTAVLPVPGPQGGSG